MTPATADPTTQLSALKDTDNAELREEIILKLADVKTLKVTNEATYSLAGQHFVGLGALEKRIVAWWEPLTSAADKLHKALTGRRAEMVKDLKTERNRLAIEMSEWKTEQDRQQRAREAQAALEEQKRQQDIAAREAALLESQGQPDLAEATFQQALEMPAPTITLAPSVPKVQGMSYRTVYEHQVVDLALVPREWLCLDDAKVKKYHEAMKGGARIAGIAFSSKDVPIGRSA